ncbi:MAG TPA: DUF192 domain-containing protein [Allosphingosinicella sp.]|jgi:uncharacterized membrane protein (UPF0127 family)
MKPNRLVLAAAAAAALLGCRAEPQAVPAQPAAARSQAGPALEVVPLEIRSASGRSHRFSVEVARTPDEQAQGLMFRERLGPGQGMLFPFPSPRPAGFWMKNTLIPLDMIFIRADGSIARIAQNTVPHSLETVTSGEPVAAVLEIAGGRSAELGISEGDRVSWAGAPGR